MVFRILTTFVITTVLFMIISCEQPSDYERLVKRELDRGVRYDSLFLGYHLGMERERFFDYSWKLNQQGVITGGVRVEYQTDDLSHPARMTFYPDFDNEGRIYRMPVEVSYNAWAPWNRHLVSDSLITDLKQHYKEIFGGGFIEAVHPDHGSISWIKVDGNRRISIFRHDDMTARVEFLDLTAAEGE